jgi:hypothetical protein
VYRRDMQPLDFPAEVLEHLENISDTPNPGETPMTTAIVAAVPAGHLPAVRLRQAGGVLRSFPASLPPDRRGRLRNGNRPGDFLAAPRCCAHTRIQGSCRQPAMANGRCRLHGGMSTGPRTAAGRERCRRARLTHGARSADIVALRREARAWCRRVHRAPHHRERPSPRWAWGASSNSAICRRGERRSPAFAPHRTNPRKRSPEPSTGERRSPLRNHRSRWAWGPSLVLALRRSPAPPLPCRRPRV